VRPWQRDKVIARVFSRSDLADSKIRARVLVGPRFGISILYILYYNLFEEGTGKEIVIYRYVYREEIPNVGPTKLRALILHCRLWGPSENRDMDFGTDKRKYTQMEHMGCGQWTTKNKLCHTHTPLYMEQNVP
jgi:hypothetical protein